MPTRGRMEAGEERLTDYWKSFWLKHAKENLNSEPQIQVLRTLDKQPISRKVFEAIVNSIAEMLEPQPGNSMLDLCCGNGVITRELINRFATVTAVDLSEEFVAQLGNGLEGNITAFAADARTVQFTENTFDRILLYAGLQYFSESETVDLFMRMRHWVRNGGSVVIGDIPDASRRWNFFDSPARESAYFEALKGGQPIVGNWFEPGWLKKLAQHAGFASALTKLQPQSFPYQHYRFDIVLKT
jgi:cyclopropane fatty-acyl-phospholipid synthase-like methyltransferase